MNIGSSLVERDVDYVGKQVKTSGKKDAWMFIFLLVIFIFVFWVIVAVVGVSLIWSQTGVLPSDRIHNFDSSRGLTTPSFGTSNFECTGVCYCSDNNSENERRSMVVIMREMKYFGVAISSVLAMKAAGVYFNDQCVISKFDECLGEDITSEVEECRPVVDYTLTEEDLVEKEQIKESLKEAEYTIRPIGMIYTQWKNPEDVPRGRKAREEIIKTAGAVIEVFEEYREGIVGLNEGDDIFVYFVFDRVKETSLTKNVQREGGTIKKRCFCYKGSN